MRNNTSVLFHLKLYMLRTKRAHQSANYQTFDCWHKINQIPYVIFQIMSQSSLIFYHPSVSWHNSLRYFLDETLYVLEKKSSSKYNFALLSALMKVHLISHAIFETTSLGFIQILHHCLVSRKITPQYFCSSNLTYSKEIFRLLNGRVRTHQIPHVILETTHQFFFKLYITLQCNGR